MIKIAPSILSADFVNLERDIKAVSAADWLHVDVMDGCFVPNITIGVPVVQSIRKCTNMFLDVHLMIDKPVRYIEAFAKAGADLLSVHLEADHPTRIAEALKCMGDGGRPALCSPGSRPPHPYRGGPEMHGGLRRAKGRGPAPHHRGQCGSALY